jgi:carboxyl-terminal processing protease
MKSYRSVKYTCAQAVQVTSFRATQNREISVNSTKTRLCMIAFSLLLLLGLPALPAQENKVAQEDRVAKNDKGAESSEAKTTAKPDAELYELLQLFVDTLDQVDRNYVKDVDRRKLVEGAIRGMMNELDPYSSYIPPKDLERFRTGVESEFGGIGIQVTTDDGYLTVISPLVGSPAYKAGIMSGDQIVAIEGESTKGISLPEAVKKLKGKVGTKVKVTLLRQGAKDREEISLERQIVKVETIMGDRRNDDATWNYLIDEERAIAYLRINSFGRRTTADLKKTLKQLQDAEKIKGLILDLRFNPGGLLSSAIEVSDLFVAKGRIVSTDGRNAPERTWDAASRGTYADFPMVVLVNRYSASASEIVSACLQDHDRAVIVGERSYGKGSVQNIVELEGGKSAMKITTAGYHRPSGKNIHREKNAADDDVWGVSPNEGFAIKASLEENRAIANDRRSREKVRRPDDEPLDHTSDKQVDAAIRHLAKELGKPLPKEEKDPVEEKEPAVETTEAK